MMPESMSQGRTSDKALLWMIRAGLVLILLTPFTSSPPPTVFPFVVGKALYSRTLIEIVFVAWVLLALFQPAYRPPRSRLLILLGAALGVAVLSACLGVSVQRSFWSSYERMQGVVDQATGSCWPSCWRPWSVQSGLACSPDPQPGGRHGDGSADRRSVPRPASGLRRGCSKDHVHARESHLPGRLPSSERHDRLGLPRAFVRSGRSRHDGAARRSARGAAGRAAARRDRHRREPSAAAAPSRRPRKHRAARSRRRLPMPRARLGEVRLRFAGSAEACGWPPRSSAFGRSP